MKKLKKLKYWEKLTNWYWHWKHWIDINIEIFKTLILNQNSMSIFLLLKTLNWNQCQCQCRPLLDGPHNSRFFVTVLKNSLNHRFHGFALAYSLFFNAVNVKSSHVKTELKPIFFSHTVLPRYLRFHYSGYFYRTYLPRIIRKT